MQTANVFSVYGAVAALTSFAAAKLSPRFYEVLLLQLLLPLACCLFLRISAHQRTDSLVQRTILASGELVQTLCVAACVVLWGGCRIAGHEVPVRVHLFLLPRRSAPAMAISDHMLTGRCFRICQSGAHLCLLRYSRWAKPGRCQACRGATCALHNVFLLCNESHSSNSA